MLKKIAFAGLGVALLASPLISSADVVSDLQAQIQALMAQVAALQGQLNPAPATPVGLTDDYGTKDTSPSCPHLNVTMQRGARDATTGGQVIDLQTFLADYYNLPEEGLVTGYFGKNTEAAVIRFQNQFSLPAFGIAGSLTRAKIASVCGGGTVLPPAPVITPAHTLVITDVQYSPAHPHVNDLITTTVTITNKSSSDRTKTFQVNVGGTAVDVPSLAAWTSTTVTVPNAFSFADSGVKTLHTVLIEPLGGGQGSTIDTYTNTLTFDSAGTGNQSFSAAPLSGIAPLAVTFTVRNANGTRYINYGDGSPNDTMLSGCYFGNEQDCTLGTLKSSHTYSQPGQYTVNLMGNSFNCPSTNCNQLGQLIITVTGNTGGITVTAPNGGEQWETGVMNTVTWTPYGYNPDINPARDVTAYLETKNNDGYRTVGIVEESGKASIHWVTGQLNAMTQGYSYAKPGNNYYIRVVNNKTGATDRSDAPFTLLPRPVDVKVNGLDGPMSLTQDQKVTVSWTSTGGRNNCSLGGVSEAPGVDNYVGNQPGSGSRELYVRLYQSSGMITATCRVGSDYSTSVYDWVSVNQTGGSLLTVLRPNGGEQIDPTKEMAVEWRYDGISSVSAALYKNDTWQRWLVKDGFPIQGQPTGGLTWQPSMAIPGLGTGDNAGAIWKIYVTGQKSDGTGYVDDKSDAPFSFTSTPTSTYMLGTIPVTQPPDRRLNPGETGVKFAQIALVNNGTTPIHLNGLGFGVNGANSSVFANGGLVGLSDGRTATGMFDGNGHAYVYTPIDLNVGQSITLGVIGNMNASFGTETGKQFGLTVDTILHDYGTALTFTGAFPTGATHTLGTPPIDTWPAFTASPTSGAVPLNVSFSASINTCTYYNIDYGDGQVAALETVIPLPHITSGCYSVPSSWPHTYSSAGSYTASLIQRGPPDKNVGTAMITVSSPTTNPTPGFTAWPNSGAAPFNVYLTMTGVSSPSAYSVNFGDGASDYNWRADTEAASTYFTSHSYGSAGTYTAALMYQPPSVPCSAPPGAACMMVLPAQVQVGSATITVSGTNCGLGGCSTTVNPSTNPASGVGGTRGSSGTNTNIANALSALESALKALMSKLGQ